MISASLFMLSLAGTCLSIPQYQGLQPDYNPTQSSSCQTNFDCIPWQSCIDGYISIDGGSGLDQRTQPANYNDRQCGQTGNMCCEIPQQLLPQVQPIEHQCGHASYDCVPYFNCKDGVIITDGEGLIDIRVRPQGTCTNPDYPDVPALCCLIPGYEPTPTPVDACPNVQECVDFNLCSPDGTINTDGSGLIDIRTGFTSCWLSSGNGGICCSPPPYIVDSCPHDSICTPNGECLTKALDTNNQFLDYLISTGPWAQCAYGNLPGVCCSKPENLVDLCPGDSVCVNPHECTGTALDVYGNFIDYISSGSWSKCKDYTNGVCCIAKPHLKPADQCGIRNYQEQLSVKSGGPPLDKNDALFGEFPWQTIIFYQNYTFICGAALISKKYVLTSAHCVNHVQALDIRLRFGEWQVNSFDEPLPYVDRNVEKIYIHPEFNPKNVHNDIAVLALANPLEFEYNINSACLPGKDFKWKPYPRCFATGWGKDKFNGDFQHILKKIDLPLVDHGTCQTLLRKTRLGRHFRLDNSFICAGGEVNKDVCGGDGGGPLVCKDPTSGQYLLTGITAWGIGCGEKDIPGVYADVAYLFDWVSGIVNSPGGQPHITGYGK